MDTIYLVNMSGDVVLAKWQVEFAIMPDVLSWGESVFQQEEHTMDGKCVYREIFFQRLIEGFPNTKLIGTDGH